jgi:hypothetical protein
MEGWGQGKRWVIEREAAHPIRTTHSGEGGDDFYMPEAEDA